MEFARLYFSALDAAISGGSCPGCWSVLFGCRTNVRLARIQFALAGINAHINRDLPDAIVATCKARATIPEHGSRQFSDYSLLNTTLDGIIEPAKKALHVRLLGEAIPPASHLED